MSNHSIPLEQAVEMTKRYRENKSRVLEPGLPSDVLPICETFSKESIQRLLSNPRAASFRIYYGMDEKLLIHAILVAADGEGKDILPSANATEDDGEILDDAVRCPPLCPPPSELNP